MDDRKKNSYVVEGERGKPVTRDKVEDFFEVFWGPPPIGMI